MDKKNYIELTNEEKNKLLSMDNKVAVLLNKLGFTVMQIKQLEMEKENIEKQITSINLDYQKEIQYILKQKKINGIVDTVDYKNNRILLK